MHWPFGIGATPHDKVPEALLETAKLHAHRALRLHLGSTGTLERLDQAFSVGASVEMLAKSALARFDYQMIAVKNPKHDTILTLAGKPLPSSSKLPSLKTVAGQEALDRLTQLTSLTIPNGTRDSIFAVRDSAVHMGLVHDDALETAMSDLVSATEKMLGLTPSLFEGLTPDDYWGGDLKDIVASIREKRMEEYESQYTALLITARDRFKVRVRFADEATLIALESVPMRLEDFEHASHHKCPACKRQGNIVYDVKRSDVQVDTSDAPHGVAYYVTQTGVPHYFICNVCELMIEGDELLAIAGMSDDIELEDDEAHEFEIEYLEMLRDLQPDERDYIDYRDYQ